MCTVQPISSKRQIEPSACSCWRKREASSIDDMERSIKKITRNQVNNKRYYRLLWWLRNVFKIIKFGGNGVTWIRALHLAILILWWTGDYIVMEFGILVVFCLYFLFIYFPMIRVVDVSTWFADISFNPIFLSNPDFPFRNLFYQTEMMMMQKFLRWWSVEVMIFLSRCLGEFERDMIRSMFHSLLWLEKIEIPRTYTFTYPPTLQPLIMSCVGFSLWTRERKIDSSSRTSFNHVLPISHVERFSCVLRESRNLSRASPTRTLWEHFI